MRRGTYCRTMSENYCVLDLETTGLSPYENEIIEIAMLRVRSGSVQQIFQTLVHPEHRISRFITNLTGISNEMVETSPAIEDVIGDAFQFLGEDLIVGHNVSFDLRFLSGSSSPVSPTPSRISRRSSTSTASATGRRATARPPRSCTNSSGKRSGRRISASEEAAHLCKTESAVQ